MTLALLSDVNFLTGQNNLRYCSDMTAMLTVQGNSWSFHTCEIRASGGLALRCDRSPHLEDFESASATTGSVMGEPWAELDDMQVPDGVSRA